MNEVHIDLDQQEAPLQILESGVVVLYLSRNADSPVTLTFSVMESMAKALKQLRDQKPAGLVIASEGRGGFCTGLDNRVKATFAGASEGETLALSGQALCRAIETLPFPTVAAIHGACLAEGLEIALACKYRIATNDISTRIGLSHVRLGVIPSFGTLGRLAGIMGLRRSSRVLCESRDLSAREALNSGLVDEIVSPRALIDHAARIACGGGGMRRHAVSLPERFLEKTTFGRKKLRQLVEKTVRGREAKPGVAWEIALSSLFASVEKGVMWRPERDAAEFGKLAVSPESRGLHRIAELKDFARALGNNGLREVEHIRTTVLGAGNMGAGIAASLAAHDCPVVLRDPDPVQLKRGAGQIRRHIMGLSGLNEAEKSFVLNLTEVTTRDSANFGNASLAIEAVQEDFNTKVKAISDLCALIPEESIIATNTSSFPIGALARDVPRPQRFLGMHFFVPAQSHELVEIIMGPETGARAIAVTAALVCRLGKYPVVVRDVPGFLVNRVMSALFTEAFAMLQEGILLSDIDRAARHFGFLQGPFQHLDEMGLDVASRLFESIYAEHGDQLKNVNFCKVLAAAGRKGRKSSSGFYDHKNGPVPFAGLRELLHISSAEKTSVDITSIEERLVMPLLNEAARCLDQGIAGSPGPEAARQIDLAIVLGGGFPAARGGPLYYADSLGAHGVAEILKRLEVKHGARFKASEAVTKRARNGRTFSS